MYQELHATQNEQGLYRRVFCTTVLGEGEYRVWLKLPISVDRNGTMVAYEFSYLNYVWRKGFKDVSPSFKKHSHLFLSEGKGVQGLEAASIVPPEIVLAFQNKLTELNAFLLSIGSANLSAPLPISQQH